MSHVDDGTLHAYLDGELSPVERERLETHLAECPSCRARIEEERALIERAGQLLGLAVPPPPERAMPPLHQLRHPRPWLRWRVPLAWAATVTFALGAGWYARGIVGTDRPASPPPGPFGIVVLPEAAPAAAERRADAAPAPPAPQRRPEGRQEQSRETVREEDRGAARAADQVVAANRDSVVQQRRVAEAPVPTRPPTLAAGMVAREAKVGTAISADSARQLLGTGLALVPNLPVMSIHQLPEGVIHIEQRVDSVTLISLLEWPPEAAQEAQGARAARPRGYASERLARYVRGVRVEIAGSISADSLNKLLELVR